jgi:Ca2+-binding RTX toxin-like protein
MEEAMLVKVLGTSTTVTGVAVDLGTNYNAFVAAGVTVGSEDSFAILGTGSNQTIEVYGTLVSYYEGAGFAGQNSSNNLIHIYEGAMVRSFAYAESAVCNAGSGSHIINDGFIKGNVGVTVGLFTTGPETLYNSGTIEGTDPNSNLGSAAIWRGSASSEITVINTGTVKSTGVAYDVDYHVFDDNPDGVDDFTNKGTIIGDIKLYAGSDFYDGRSGRIIGIVSGGDGNDTIFGGRENNTILGGSGSDSIYGGAGADELTGGADGDVFLFTSVKDSTVSVKGQDTITDFAHGDLLELQSIDFNTKKNGLQHAHWIGTKDFSHVAGELRYEKTASDTHVYADTNGDGKADFAIHLDDAIKLSIHDVFL